MYNYKKIVGMLAMVMIMVVSMGGKVNSQEIQDRFFNYTYHDIATGSGDLIPSLITYAYNASYSNQQTLVVINERNIYYPAIATFDTVASGQPINVASFFNYADVPPYTDTVTAMVQVGQYVYAAGYNSIYRLDLLEGVTNSTLPNTIIDAIGGFYFNNKVYFVCTSNIFYFTHDANVPLSTTNTPTSSFSIGTDQASSWVVDTSAGYLFVGGSAGHIAVINLNTNTLVGEYLPPSSEAGYSRQSTLIDTRKREIYSCSGSTDLVTQMDVFTYEATITDMTDFVFNSSHAFNDLSACNGGAYDSTQGQIFFIGPSSINIRAIIGIGPRGQEQEIHYFYDDTQSLRVYTAWANADTKQVTVVTDSQLYSINYKSVCPDNCNGVGACIDGACICPADGTYNGTYCEIKTCIELNDCSGNGECSNGICNCDPNYLGADDCSVKSCYYDCSGAGTCNNQTYTCTCNEGKTGDYCQNIAPPPVCETITSSQNCVDHVYCGWCESSGSCKTGNRYGPAEGFCRTWYFNQNVEIGVIVLAAIFIGLIGLLFVNDIVSTVPLDMGRAKAYEVEFRTGTYPKATHEEASVLWWRDQRSSKAWTLMDQFQFISLISHMGVIFPSRFLHFTEYLDWTNLGIPFPSSVKLPEESFPSRDNYDATSRSTLTYAQYNNVLESGSMYHLANILFWFGILCAAILVPLAIVFVVLKFIESKVHWREVIRNRIIHCTIRLLTFGYIGVVMAASFSVAADPHSYKIIIPGAILIALYGIGMPVAIWFLLAVPEARLHNPTFKQQFGCLYVNFKPKTDHRFVVFSYIKRFFMALIIGVLAFTPEPVYPLSGSDLAVPIVQAVVIALVIIGYAVLLIIRRPYFDHYHQWLEYLLAIINLATVGLCLSHIKSPSVAGELLVGLVQAIALVACIFAYIISWLQMRSTFLAKISKIFSFCKCGRKDKNIDMNNIDK
ncbi:substrate adhesion molecule [Cavenderia fasciculata]|uniref:Substrate adhesion molecule n=1 Tax=Cavenderia fasciculata TaxID=261658 RepID=F4PZS7_CACFS|nr:substrate adhesion molecule [Cavenderia fasciculata]EGG18841.1 substrate adhesion molecule [Cavenderia fasciculata]|eukprot:XP_004357303.1 substrate adhesion molecule [Cavenderia fasciculata]